MRLALSKFTESLFAQVQQAANAVGVSIDFSRIATMPNTADAHRLLSRASQLGSAEQCERLLERRWSPGLVASLLQAGVPLDRGLEIMLRVSDDSRQQQLIGPIQEGVRRGVSLSRVLAERPGLFSTFYISMVQAAEIAGDLAAGLGNLAYYLERSKTLRDKLVSAMIYPLILLLVSVASLLIILTYVIPQFRQLFDDMGASLPLSTALVIGIAESLRSYGALLLLGICAGLWLLRRLLRQAHYRQAWDGLMLRLPLPQSGSTDPTVLAVRQRLADVLGEEFVQQAVAIDWPVSAAFSTRIFRKLGVPM